MILPTTNGAQFDATKFCPDGVHPSSDYTGNSNWEIAKVYLDQLKNIFCTTTKSIDSQIQSAANYGWEDVELL